MEISCVHKKSPRHNLTEGIFLVIDLQYQNNVKYDPSFTEYCIELIAYCGTESILFLGELEPFFNLR